MRLWQFRRRPAPERVNVDRSILGPLAVPDTEPWWIVIHKIIDAAEWETIDSARTASSKPNECMAAVNAGEGVALVRQKINEARAIALQLGGIHAQGD